LIDSGRILHFFILIFFAFAVLLLILGKNMRLEPISAIFLSNFIKIPKKFRAK